MVIWRCNMPPTKEETITNAKNLQFCTEDLKECFEGELCPISHSTACCLHCAEFPHEGLDNETKRLIMRQGHCNEIRCFRAKAIMVYGVDIPQPTRPELTIAP